MKEPRILNSNVTAGTYELFEQQRDRFDLFDAAAMVNIAQRLGRFGMLNNSDSVGSSSAEDTAGKKKLQGPAQPNGQQDVVADAEL